MPLSATDYTYDGPPLAARAARHAYVASSAAAVGNAGTAEAVPEGYNLFNDPPTRQPNFRAAAMFAAGLVFVAPQPSDVRPPVYDGWEVQAMQAPHFQRRQIFPELSWRFDSTTLPQPAALDWGFEPALPGLKQTKPVYAALGGKNAFAFFRPFRPDGWEVQAMQPPHPRPERAGAVQRGDDGTALPMPAFQAHGWEVQPPHFQRRQIFLEYGWRLDSTTLPQPAALSWGFEATRPQPPRPAQYRAAACLPGPANVDVPLFQWLLFAWENQAPQPPMFRRRQPFPELSWRHDQPAVPVVPLNWGFEAEHRLSRPLQNQAGAILRSGQSPEAVLAVPPVSIVRPQRLLATPGRVRLVKPG